MPISLLLYTRKNNWLISEIGFDAKDNGFSFFEYLRKEHPEINVIYVISNKNMNFKKVYSLGNTVEPHSFKHLIFFTSARVLINTNNYGFSPYGYLDVFLNKFRFFLHPKCVNLKHGIDKDLCESEFKINAKQNLVVSGAYPEYQFILKNYGYSKNEVVLSGYPRFDNLFGCVPKNDILIMPTWRRWLENISVNEFALSEFYVCWNRLLNEPNLKELHSLGYNIHFFIHPLLNRYSNLFSDIPSYIVFHDYKNSDLQKIIKNSKMLITDFSSVFFDFAYMNRPVVYYQFDEGRFFKEHYKKSSYFDYRMDGFGPVCMTADNVMKVLSDLYLKDFENDHFYKKRTDLFFGTRDNHNSERVFNKIIELF